MQDTEIPALKTLADCTPSELRALYEEIFKIRPGTHARADFMRSNIAWAHQAIQDNQDPVLLREELADKSKKTTTRNRLVHRAGTRLIREWQGLTHEVSIQENGYLWRGKRYRSLSRIAREITGAHWSGPRFFGLQQPDQ